MDQVKPGEARLYGSYSVPPTPLRSHTTPCAGSDVRNRHRTPAPGNFRGSSAYPISPIPPQRPCRPMTVHGANRFGQPQQRAPFRLQEKMPKCCERPHNKVQYPCERQQQRATGVTRVERVRGVDKEIQPVSISPSARLNLHRLHVDLNVAFAALTVAETQNQLACKTPAILLACKGEGDPGVTTAWGLNLPLCFRT